MLLLYVLLTAATHGLVPTETPAGMPTTCITTTIDGRGRFTNSAVAVGSGSGSIDRDALKLIKGTDLARLFPRKVERQSGYVLVRADESGAVTMGFAGKLLDSCRVGSVLRVMPGRQAFNAGSERLVGKSPLESSAYKRSASGYSGHSARSEMLGSANVRFRPKAVINAYAVCRRGRGQITYSRQRDHAGRACGDVSGCPGRGH